MLALKKNTFDTIYHEHLDYHSLSSIVKFLKKFNLKLFDFNLTKAQGGSIRIYASKKLRYANKKKITNQIFKERINYKLFDVCTYKKFEKKINRCRVKLQNIFSIFDKKKFNVVGYGAAAKTTTFLHYFDLSNTKQIKKIFDDNILKQNLYLPGTAIKILNPEYLDFKNVDIITCNPPYLAMNEIETGLYVCMLLTRFHF